MGHVQTFGEYVRQRRENLAESDRAFSVRQVAKRVGLEPSYLSKIERGEQPPPGEDEICRLAKELGDNPDLLLAMAGKVSTDVLNTIRARPMLFAELLRELKTRPDKAINRLVQEVRDGEW